MLNPSTADALLDDPTIRRCLNFAAREDCGRLIVVNLFTFRSAYPKDLIEAHDPVGPDGDTALEHAAHCLRSDEASRVIFGWGSVSGPKWFRTMYKDRVEKAISVFENIRAPQCFVVNKDGSPKHPLYVANDKPLRAFPVGGK